VAAYRWLLAQGVDPRYIILMGDSAGGGLVLATMLRLRDEGVELPGPRWCSRPGLISHLPASHLGSMPSSTR
jgi:acetyl esterase/lipase